MSAYKMILKNSRGMSIIEILIALTLLGLAGKVFDNLQEGRVDSTKIQIQKLGERLKDFRRKCGQYPLTEQGLDALLTAPTGGKECKRYPPDGFIEGGKIPQDPWEMEFTY